MLFSETNNKCGVSYWKLVVSCVLDSYLVRRFFTFSSVVFGNFRIIMQQFLF